MMDHDFIPEKIDAFLDGSNDPQIAHVLANWIRADQTHAAAFAEHVFIDQSLREVVLGQLKTDKLSAAACGQAAESSAAMAPAANIPHHFATSTWLSSGKFLLASIVLALLSAGIAYQVGRGTVRQTGSVVKDRAEAGAQANVPRVTPCVARLIYVGDCRWDSGRTTADLIRGSQLQPGQSLHLLEGLAQLDLTSSNGSVERFQLEGPAGVIMSSTGVLTLLYGRLSVSVKSDFETFSLDSPFGRLVVSEDASFGTLATANEVEIHVFSGSVLFEPLGAYRSLNDDRGLRVKSGQSLILASSKLGSITAERGIADEAAFVTARSQRAHQLIVTDEYVAAVKSRNPLVYWRFANVRGGVVSNEMSDRFAGRIYGPVRLHQYSNGNQSAEFGSNSQPAFILSDDGFDEELRKGFTVELWAKPAYFHTATLFSLAGNIVPDSDLPSRCVLIEDIGPVVDPAHYSIDNHSRVRFLHRNPPLRDDRVGVSIYSKDAYIPRQWQHVVAVKDRNSTKLYLDGNLVAQAEDCTDTPSGLHILLGQLYAHTTGSYSGVRAFLGELDEIAVYDQPLREADIVAHYRLIHDSSDHR